eukprot:123258-Hanusia_phi.AAC.11
MKRLCSASHSESRGSLLGMSERLPGPGHEIGVRLLVRWWCKVPLYFTLETPVISRIKRRGVPGKTKSDIWGRGKAKGEREQKKSGGEQL